ncbi:MAG: hypothetical protein RI894_2002, partial [Bacteroidota bacterium]
MGYSNYKSLKKTLNKLDLEELDLRLFEDILPVQPSAWLVQTLAIGEKFPTTNEKGKSERVISPIMLEIALP